MGATISASMELYNSNAPLNINTPNKPEMPYNPDQEWDEKTCLTEECVFAIRKLVLVAEEYLSGVRQQTSLFEAEKNSDQGETGPLKVA